MGKSSAPPPDYTPLLELGREGLTTMRDIAGRQEAFAREQYNEMLPIARAVSQSQLDTQSQLRDQARQYFEEQQGLMTEARAYDTGANRERLAREAAAAASQAFGTTQGMLNRAQAARGISPTSGAALAMQQQSALGLAAQRAGMMNAARQQATEYGKQLRYAALGLSAPSVSAGQAAVGAGAAGLASANMPGAQYAQGLSQMASTTQAGYGIAGGALGNVLSAQSSAYNASLSQDDPFATSSGAGLGGWAGGGFQGAGSIAKLFSSDRRLKQNIELVGRDERTGLNLYEFEYKDEPDRRFRGVMADEVLDYMPKAVVTRNDGYMAVRYDLLGIDMVEVAHG